MHVVLPPALSDRGVWGCVSPDVPSLPDLLSNPAGDEQDEERFRQNLSALPTPAGGVLLIDEVCVWCAQNPPPSTAGTAVNRRNTVAAADWRVYGSLLLVACSCCLNSSSTNRQ
jgi:hypothetical protein